MSFNDKSHPLWETNIDPISNIAVLEPKEIADAFNVFFRP
jgi:hypothetical protein